MMGRFNYLPKDIMLEILIRLPTESVLECKLVCKLWRDIVHLPSFSHLHLARLNSSADDTGKFGFIILRSERDLPDLYYYAEYDENCHDTPPRETRMDFKPPENCFFVGSCNGLTCFNSWDHPGPYYICNPITREYIILPDFQGKCRWNGFGYSSSTNEYKVIRMYEDSNVGIVLQIYTLGSGTGWRTVQNMDMNMMKKVSICTGEFANGALHWLDRPGTVIAFDLTYEIFSELPLPPPCLTQASVPYYSIRLKALSGFISAYFHYKSGCTELWLLKKNIYNSDLSWSKDFSFKSTICTRFGFMKCGTLLCYCSWSICCYDPKASSVSREVSFRKCISQALPHQNTLVSLKVLGEKDTKTMEFGERACSSDETGNTDELKKPQTKYSYGRFG